MFKKFLSIILTLCLILSAVPVSISEGTEHVHSYTEQVQKKATCTEAGEILYTCDCGDSYTKSIAAAGHHYADGLCTVCGAADPNAAPAEEKAEKSAETPEEEPAEETSETPEEKSAEESADTTEEKQTVEESANESAETPEEPAEEASDESAESTEEPTEDPAEDPIEEEVSEEPLHFTEGYVSLKKGTALWKSASKKNQYATVLAKGIAYAELSKEAEDPANDWLKITFLNDSGEQVSAFVQYKYVAELTDGENAAFLKDLPKNAPEYKDHPIGSIELELTAEEPAEDAEAATDEAAEPTADGEATDPTESTADSEATDPIEDTANSEATENVEPTTNGEATDSIEDTTTDTESTDPAEEVVNGTEAAEPTENVKDSTDGEATENAEPTADGEATENTEPTADGEATDPVEDTANGEATENAEAATDEAAEPTADTEAESAEEAADDVEITELTEETASDPTLLTVTPDTPSDTAEDAESADSLLQEEIPAEEPVDDSALSNLLTATAPEEPATVLTIVNPPAALGAGKSVTLKATLTEDETALSTETVTWSISDTDLATLTVKKGVATIKVKTLKTAETLTVTASYQIPEGDLITDECTIAVGPAVTKVTITAPRTYMDVNAQEGGEMDTLQLTAAVLPAAASNNVKWTTSNAAIATVDENGLVTAQGKTGKVTITATAQDGSSKKATFSITVLSALKGISFTDSEITLGQGKSITLKPILNPDGTTQKSLTWTSSLPKMVTVSSSGTVKAAKNPGEPVTITVASKDNPAITATIVINVVPLATKVSVSAEDGSTIIDWGSSKHTLQLSASVSPAEANQQVTWSTSNKKIATVDENGLVTALQTGSVTITATAADGSKVKGTYAVSVGVPLKELSLGYDPDTVLEVGVGKSLTLKAQLIPSDSTQKTLTWTSSNSKLVSVSGSGTIKGLKQTTEPVTITVASKENPAITTSVQVMVMPLATAVKLNQTTATIDIDDENPTLQLSASVLPDVLRQQVTWTSSNQKIATVDENGLVTPVSTGTVKITATAMDGSKKSASCTVQVVRAIKDIQLSVEEGSLITLAVGKSLKITATPLPSTTTQKTLTWTSGNTALVTVSSGTIKAKKATGGVPVTVKVASSANPDVYAEVYVQVLPAAKTVTISGEDGKTGINLLKEEPTLALQATVLPADASQNVAWTTSSAAIATVDENGVVTAHKTGTATITATVQDGTKKKGTFKVTVFNAPTALIVEGEDTALSGETLQMTVTAEPAGAPSGVKWSLSDGASYASISSDGKLVLKSSAAGKTVTVRATSTVDTTLYGEKTITVYGAAESIRISPETDTMVISGSGNQLQLTAEVLPETAMGQVEWSSSDKDIAVVDSTGLVTSLCAGSVVITAKATDGSGTSASKTLQIIQGADSINISADSSLKPGAIVQYTAEVLPSSAAQSVTWRITSGSDIATIDSATGLVTVSTQAKAGQNITVQAVHTVSTDTVAEKNAVVQNGVSTLSLQVSGSSEPITDTLKFDRAKTASVQLVAVTNTEGASESILWSSSDPAVATVENGVITFVSTGTVTITATPAYASVVKAQAQIENCIAVQSVTVNAPEKAGCGTQIQLSAAVTPANADDLSVTWSVTDENGSAVSYASIDENGLLTTEEVTQAATLLVKATSLLNPEVSGTAAIALVPKVQQIILSVGSNLIDLNQKQTLTISRQVLPAEASQTLQWTTGDDTIATVEDGTVTFLKAGKVTITARATDGSNVTAALVLEAEKPEYTYTLLDDGTLRLDSYLGNAANLVVPGTVMQKTVTQLAEGLFKNHTEITTAVLPASVTEVSAELFMGCTELTSVTLSDSVTVIGARAFKGCTKLAEMEGE